MDSVLHVHIIVHADEVERVGLMMPLVAGAFAQQRHRRNGNEGSVWEHPYHFTAIQDGRHLLNCLRYVSLNMVRAGVVDHPRQWAWCSHDELIGTRSRYRMLAMDRLLESVDMSELRSLRAVYEEGMPSRSLEEN